MSHQVASPVRLAVIGAGFIGRRHIELLRRRPDLFQCVAAADPSPASARYLEAAGIPCFGDYRQLIDKVRPEGVIIATPNALHEEGALAAIEARIPALVEKPVTDTLAAALRLVSAVRASGVPVLVGHHRRHNPLLKAAKDYITTGALGEILSVAAINLRRKPDAYFDIAWHREPGGGPLLINGIHDFDCLRWLCGEITHLFAMTGNRGRGHPVEDCGAVTMKFSSGAIGSLTISDAVQAPWAWEIASGEEPDYPREAEDCYMICGTKGSLAVPTLTVWRNERGGGRADPFHRHRLFYVPADPWAEELVHFADVVRGLSKPLVTAADAARTLSVVLAIARSAETGEPVSPEPIED